MPINRENILTLVCQQRKEPISFIFSQVNSDLLYLVDKKSKRSFSILTYHVSTGVYSNEFVTTSSVSAVNHMYHRFLQES